MNIWIYLLITTLTIPSIMIGIGSYFTKKPPTKINTIYGYRTSMSMKNQNTWKFAHNHCGKIWQTTGLYMLPPTILTMILIAQKQTHTISIYTCILITIQTIILIGTIIPTEKALKNNFDKNGNPKK